MTISSTVRTAGPFTGDGIAGSFPFTFKVFATSDLVVVQTVAGVDTTLTLGTDYGVTLNADQNAAPGGALISKVAGVNTPLTAGYIWNATSAVGNLQPVKLTNNGGFFPAVINDALDRLTILVQQLVRAVNVSLQYPLSDGTTISNLLPNKAARAGKMLGFDPATGAPVVTTKTLATIEAGADTATAQAAIATAAAATATAQAGIATTQQGIATTQAGTATAQAALALGYSNISLNSAGYGYTFSTNVASSDPGAGFLKFNNATLSAATALYISETSALAQGLAAIIAMWDDSTTAIHSQIKIVKGSDPTVFAVFNITGAITDNGTWDTITVAYVGGNGAFANNDTVFIQNARTGDQGVAGSGIFAGGTAGGTANALTFTPTPSVGAYTVGMTLTGNITTTNTGSPTVNVSGVAATSTRKSIGGALVALVQGDLQAGVTRTFVYDGTFWVLQNPAPYAQGADIASAGTINLDTATGDYVNITGTTGITAVTLQQGREATVKFAGILTITNGASLLNVSAANITTAAGDIAVFRGEASGVVRMVDYVRASGSPLIASAGGITSGGYTANQYYTGMLILSGGNSQAVVANRLIVSPFILGAAATFTKIGFHVSTLSAGSARIGIYNMANGVPSTLVLDCGTVSTSTTGDKEIVISQALTAGCYAIAVVFNATPSVLIADQNSGGYFQAASFIFGSPSTGAIEAVAAYQAFAFAAMPAPWSGALTVSQTGTDMGPIVWMRL